LLKEHKYIERAKGIQVIIAAKTVSEKLKEEKKLKRAKGIRKVEKAQKV